MRERPAVNFFEGALLGNGGLGVVVTMRPDAVVLRFGHNDVWDIRVAEEHADEARRPPHWRSRAARSASSATKGDNDLVFLNLQAARLENFALPVVVNECLLQGNDGPERRAFNEAIEDADSLALSAASLVELSSVIEARFGADGVRHLDRFLERAQVKVVPVDLEQAQLARQAWSRFGKGRHVAMTACAGRGGVRVSRP